MSQTYHFKQSKTHLKDIHFTGEWVASCYTTMNELPYKASLYRTQTSPVTYVGVMEVMPLNQLEAVAFCDIATDEMEMFFGDEASFLLFQKANMPGYHYVGHSLDNIIEVSDT